VRSMYGDTATARKRVFQLREQAGDVRALADRLVAQSESVPWHGRAAEAMRLRVKERAAHLKSVAAQHDTAADSLARHVAEVDLVKEAIESRSHKAARMVGEARDRVAHAEYADTAASATGEAATARDAETDAVILAFDPPPAGHKDWLAVDLPGL